MIQYPLTVTVPIKERLFNPDGMMYGMDLEAELSQWTVEQFQMIDPSLSTTYVRGRFVSAAKAWNSYDETIDITISQSSANITEMWKDIPVDFLIGIIEGHVNTRTINRPVGKIVHMKRRSK